jgi:hypothetical protein
MLNESKFCQVYQLFQTTTVDLNQMLIFIIQHHPIKGELIQLTNLDSL